MSQLENCPTCGNATSENAAVCPSCGEPFKAGWATAIREREKVAEAEALRLENEELDRLDQLRLDVIIAKNKAKKKKYKIWTVVVIGLLILLLGPSYYDDYQMNALKNENPEEYQKIIAARLLAKKKKRQKEIIRLEKQVAAIPATAFKDNIAAYKKLLKLSPSNQKYKDKFSYYAGKIKQEKRDAATKASAIKAKEKAVKFAAEKEKRRYAFHCLSGWDGSHAGVEKYVKNRLRDPNSYEYIETKTTPVNQNGTNTLYMSYRAKNGFGGMTVGQVVATIKNSNCKVIDISSE